MEKSKQEDRVKVLEARIDELEEKFDVLCDCLGGGILDRFYLNLDLNRAARKRSEQQ